MFNLRIEAVDFVYTKNLSQHEIYITSRVGRLGLRCSVFLQWM
jgi:hypothetical protein